MLGAYGVFLMPLAILGCCSVELRAGEIKNRATGRIYRGSGGKGKLRGKFAEAYTILHNKSYPVVFDVRSAGEDISGKSH